MTVDLDLDPATWFGDTPDALDAAERDIETSILEDSFHAYLTAAWPWMVPSAPFQDNWHNGCVCAHLEAITKGQLQWLVINIPPRFGKSLTASVAWPTWVWARRTPPRAPGDTRPALSGPSTRFLYSSYDAKLAGRDAWESRKLMRTEWYQSRWGARWRFAGDQNVKTQYYNDKGGSRLAIGVRGAVTGQGGDVKVIDDPHNVKDIESDTTRPAVLTWYDTTWSTRSNDPRSTPHLIIGQRTHVADLFAHVLSASDAKKWTVVNLAMEYSKTYSFPASLGWADPRTEEGQLLWPERFTPAAVTALKLALGPYAEAQLNQRPIRVLGGVITRADFRYWTKLPDDLMTDPDDQCQSWDMTFGDSIESTSYVDGVVWKRKGANVYLIDETRDKLVFDGAVQAVRHMTAAHPEVRTKLVEDKANGPAIVSHLQREIPGLIPYTPKGSKLARFIACSPYFKAGNVFVPDPNLPGYGWVKGFVAELCGETGDVNDRRDATSQAFDWLYRLRAHGALQIFAPIPPEPGAETPAEATGPASILPPWHPAVTRPPTPLSAPLGRNGTARPTLVMG